MISLQRVLQSDQQAQTHPGEHGQGYSRVPGPRRVAFAARPGRKRICLNLSQMAAGLALAIKIFADQLMQTHRPETRKMPAMDDAHLEPV